ncbi:hypothetical protein VZT92_017195 [Zoarces viviparus]|uniref:Ubiquitin-like domain-containing protein n=1 Tax=Zoarces viviparus TaxID=48416 RepID=A0AAW1EU32_ZOAVI
MEVQLAVMTPKGEEILFDLCDSELELEKMTVLQMTNKIAEKLQIDNLRIVYRTKPLEEDKLVGSYGIQHLSVVQTVLMLPGGF